MIQKQQVETDATSGNKPKATKLIPPQRTRTAETASKPPRGTLGTLQTSENQRPLQKPPQRHCSAPSRSQSDKIGRKEQLLQSLLPPGWTVEPGGTTHMAQVIGHMLHMWAGSTWASYGSVWGRYLEYCLEHGLEPEESQNGCLWVVSTVGTTEKVSLQGQHQYAKTLSAVFGRLGWHCRYLSMMAAGMRNQGALIPIHQALAITLAELRILLADKRLATVHLGLMLAWSSASRWDDIVNLTRSMFIYVAVSRLIISWSDQTKTTKGDPFRSSAYVVLEGSFTSAIFASLPQDPQDNITAHTTAQLDRLLKKCGYQWSGHSFKRGAANHLVRQAAEGRFDLALLPQLLKHKSATDFNSCTIRYVGDHVSLALALRTAEATRLL